MAGELGELFRFAAAAVKGVCRGSDISCPTVSERGFSSLEDPIGSIGHALLDADVFIVNADHPDWPSPDAAGFLISDFEPDGQYYDAEKPYNFYVGTYRPTAVEDIWRTALILSRQGSESSDIQKAHSLGVTDIENHVDLGQAIARARDRSFENNDVKPQGCNLTDNINRSLCHINLH